MLSEIKPKSRRTLRMHDADTVKCSSIERWKLYTLLSCICFIFCTLACHVEHFTFYVSSMQYLFCINTNVIPCALLAITSLYIVWRQIDVWRCFRVNWNHDINIIKPYSCGRNGNVYLSSIMSEYATGRKSSYRYFIIYSH